VRGGGDLLRRPLHAEVKPDPKIRLKIPAELSYKCVWEIQLNVLLDNRNIAHKNLTRSLFDYTPRGDTNKFPQSIETIIT